MASPFGTCGTCEERPGIAYVRKAPVEHKSPLDSLVLVSICAECMADYLRLIKAAEART